MFDIKEFTPRSTAAKAYRSNLFSVKFLSHPTLVGEPLELMELTTCETSIPGSDNSWYINVLLTDTAVFDAFRAWHKATVAERQKQENIDYQSWNKTLLELGCDNLCAQATITLYGSEGEIVTVYNLTGIEIEQISELCLNWMDDDTVLKFSVSFKVASCEPAEV
jgi:hypothetical protein